MPRGIYIRTESHIKALREVARRNNNNRVYIHKTHCKYGHMKVKRSGRLMCPECARRTAIKSYHKQPETKQKAARKRTKDLKLEVLTHYGPEHILQCSFSGCTICDIDMLTLDHIQNNGAEERKGLYGKNKGMSGGSRRVYSRVKREGFPGGFQTLCWNHQWKKELTRVRDQYF